MTHNDLHVTINLRSKAIFSNDGRQVITASSDGTVKIWNTKTAELASTHTPQVLSGASEVSIHSVQLWPRNPEQIVVCNRSNTVMMMNMYVTFLSFSCAGPPARACVCYERCVRACVTLLARLPVPCVLSRLAC